MKLQCYLRLLIILTLSGTVFSCGSGKTPLNTPALILSVNTPTLSLSGKEVISTLNADRITQLAQFKKDGMIQLIYSPDGTQLAVSSDPLGIFLYDAHTMIEVRRINTKISISNPIFTPYPLIAYSPAGITLAIVDSYKEIVLWSTQTVSKLITLNIIDLQEHWIMSLAFAPDGVMLASGCADGAIIMFNSATGAQLNTLKGHTDLVYSLTFAPDGKTLASGSADGKIILWDSHTGAQLKTLKGNTGFVYSVAYAPDGKTLASGSMDGTIILWDAQTGARLKTLKGHTKPVLIVTYAPDGKTLASGSMDGTIILWDTQTGAQLKTLKGDTNIVKSVSYAPDGKTLASGSGDGTMWFWGVGEE